MTFTTEEMEVLRNWEGHFRTMIESNYCRNLRAADIDRLDAIRNRALNVQRRTNKNCGVCISELIRAVAPLYYADKAEMALEGARRAKADTLSTDSVQAPPKPRKRK